MNGFEGTWDIPGDSELGQEWENLFFHLDPQKNDITDVILFRFKKHDSFTIHIHWIKRNTTKANPNHASEYRMDMTEKINGETSREENDEVPIFLWKE